MNEGLYRRQFRIASALGVGYWVVEVHEGGFTSQIGRTYKSRDAAVNHLEHILIEHTPKFVPTHAAIAAKNTPPKP